MQGHVFQPFAASVAAFLRCVAAITLSTCQRAVAWSDRVDSDHAQAEMLRVLQLLLAHVKTITEEVVVCAGHSAETGEDKDRRSTRDRCLLLHRSSSCPT